MFYLIPSFCLIYKKLGIQAVDLAFQNGVDLDGTPIPPKMLSLYNWIKDKEVLLKIN